MESHDAYDNEQEAREFKRRNRLAKIEDADGGDEGGADAGPDGIGDAHLDFFERQGKGREGRGIKDKEEHRLFFLAY